MFLVWVKSTSESRKCAITVHSLILFPCTSKFATNLPMLLGWVKSVSQSSERSIIV
ncbi:hypothetical protein SB48_HM08orf00268 [Heyndrickxia coagulans]|uniref:Uncharacterized protein n=1 Tax=Heyndrickxia coagulans TaxID=1398 RepID=A0AAN0T393_HEYCO|nr:hypothetical protein SB48_HM08orf00268 [Heyndrickxia coagulans]